MNNQSLFVKIVIWFMVFLMSVGFAALVVAPFMGGTDLFGDSSGRGATQQLVDEARADIAKNDCTSTDPKPTGKQLERCKEALLQLASSYTTLASPDEGATEAPRDSRRNQQRAWDAYRTLYELDTKDEESATMHASALRAAGKAAQALPIWAVLVKEHPQNEDYILAQADAHSAAGDPDKAIATYRLYVKRFPDSGQIDLVKEEIENLQEQKEQAAAGGGQTITGPDGQPISIG